MALAKWYKIDFHTHSPASKCFKDKSVTAKQWINAAKQAGLDAVVLTDHNSVAFMNSIDSLQEEDKKDIKVFCGIELCVSADYAHIIVIFDDKLTTRQIEDAIIQYLQLPHDKWGDTTVNVTEDRLKDLCSAYRDHILVIPAHFASDKGLGKSNINAIRKYKEFIQFDAIEIRNESDKNTYENCVKNEAINKAALVSGSDNPSSNDQGVHSIEGFGTAFTWIKTSSLTFEGLKQVFLDPEHRCINMLRLKEIGEGYDPNEVTYNYISGIKIEDIKHLNKLDIRFSPGLNCIIGGRGTGKSTVVDAIYYGLQRGENLSKCALLDNTLQNEGKITTYYSFGTSKDYMIEAQRQRDKLLYTCFDDNGVIEEPPEYKVDFYGQKKIYNLVDEDGDTLSEESSPLIRMLDDRIQSKLYSYKDEINSIMTELLQKASLYKNNRKKISELPTLKAEVEKAKATMARFKASGIEEKRGKYEVLERSIRTTQANILSYLSKIEKTIEQYDYNRNEYGLTLAKLKDEPEENKDSIEAIEGILTSCDHIIDKLHEEQTKVVNINDKYGESSIHMKLLELHATYLEAIEDVKLLGKEDIQNIQDTLQNNNARIVELEKVSQSQSDVLETIKTQIDKLIETKLNLSNLRQESIDDMHMDDTGIKFIVSPMSHAERFKSNIQKEFKHDAYDEDYTKLVNAVLDPSNN